MPSGMLSSMMTQMVREKSAANVVVDERMNTISNNGAVAKTNEKFVLPKFIEGEVLTRRSNCETTRQMA